MILVGIFRVPASVGRRQRDHNPIGGKVDSLLTNTSNATDPTTGMGADSKAFEREVSDQVHNPSGVTGLLVDGKQPIGKMLGAVPGGPELNMLGFAEREGEHLVKSVVDRVEGDDRDAAGYACA